MEAKVEQSPAMTLAEAAAYLNSKLNWIRTLIARGDLSYQRAGKRFIVPRAEVEALLRRGWCRNGK